MNGYTKCGTLYHKILFSNKRELLIFTTCIVLKRIVLSGEKKKKADPKRVNTEWIHWYDNLEIATYRAGELINVGQKLGMSKGMTSVAVKEEHRRHCWW